ncbi:hypothetical protein N9997_03210 [Synechococcus sp. AH-603-L18]|nr:hypothetical protein [Synechococcus sp. AH-603-L18]MDB4338331.1 hypothetical protein [Synechococcus sp. AH-603-L18]
MDGFQHQETVCEIWSRELKCALAIRRIVISSRIYFKNQCIEIMKLLTSIAAFAIVLTSLVNAIPAKAYSNCIYLNKSSAIKTPISCRVINEGVNGAVIFIDEYRSDGVIRHDERTGWYSPRYRSNDCLLRKQGVESICHQKVWDGI